MAGYDRISLLLLVLMMTLSFCSIVVPPANDSKVYNDWASENRFRHSDTLLYMLGFKYTKDSVMEVTETEYEGCNSTRPAFFSSTGNSVYSLNHSGAFYFISGVSGHCLKGQRMIVKVLTSDESQTVGGGGSRLSAADFMPFWALKLASVIRSLCLAFSRN